MKAGTRSRHRWRRRRLAVELLEARLAPSVNVLTYHNDIASTGANLGETALSPANVKVGSFGKLFTTPVDGNVYAEPLVDTGVTIAAGPNTRPGAAGVHDVVFVATEHDSLYAIDAAVTGGAVLWQRSFLPLTDPDNNTLGATAITSVPAADVGTGDLSPEIGITGTPVIDPGTNTLYVVAKTKETIAGADHYVQRLHAVNLADGTDRVAPFLIGDTTGGNSNNTAIYVYGSGDGHVTDPYNSTGQQVVQFNALREHQRGALSLVNHTVYVEWASHGDNGPYHGWVAAWDVANGFRLTGALNTTPNGGLAGVWQGGGRLAFEADGSAFYLETGNGPGGHGNPTLCADGFPADGNYYEALIKVVADPSTSPTNQNKNGWGLKVADYFIPYNQVALDNAAQDFGSGGPMLLPDAAGIAGHPHLLVAAGKEGKIYLIDRANLRKYDPNNDHVVNAVPDGGGHDTPPVQIGGALNTAAYYNGKIYWTGGYSDAAHAYVINADGTLSATSQTAATFGYLPGSAVVSADGTANGIVWVMDRNANRLRAYDAATLATELWDSGQKAGGADALGAVVKFAVPTVANGEVYVGTSDSLVVYGLTPPANAAPAAPALSVTAVSGTAVNLSWTDSTAPPNTATGYAVEQSPDGTTFTQVTTAPAGATSVSVGGLAPLTTYYFRVRGFNTVGDSPYSNVASATTTAATSGLVAAYNFDEGSGTTLTDLSGKGNNGTITDATWAAGKFGTALAFTGALDSFVTVADSATLHLASGMTLEAWVNPGSLDSPAAGWAAAISKENRVNMSTDIDYALYAANGTGTPPAVHILQNGSDQGVQGTDVLPLNTWTFLAATYDGTNLNLYVNGNLAGSTSLPGAIDLTTDPLRIGGDWSGEMFTGLIDNVRIYNTALTSTAIQADMITPVTAPTPAAPSALGAVPASATSITLSWTNNAANQAGFHLDRATDAGFTQNLITEALPASPATFTDTASGLAPGGTFYYRLRAFNAAGDSANSNMATVSIPLAPAKPTNSQVTAVTTGEVDLSWTDNASRTADGYLILRKVGAGAFVSYATLPAKNAAPPSTYTWSDTGVTPGTAYEYHIEAYNISGNNDFAGTNVTTLTLPPGSLSVTGVGGAIQLSWTAPVGAVSYNIYRGLAAGGEALYQAGVTGTTFRDTADTGRMTYYTVTAVNANGTRVPTLPSESAASNEVSTTFYGLPSPPIRLGFGFAPAAPLRLATARGFPPRPTTGAGTNPAANGLSQPGTDDLLMTARPFDWQQQADFLFELIGRSGRRTQRGLSETWPEADDLPGR
jgi:hypothetical protein